MKKLLILLCLVVMVGFMATSGWTAGWGPDSSEPYVYTSPIDSILDYGASAPSEDGEKGIFANYLGITIAELDALYIYTKDESMSDSGPKDYNTGYDSPFVGAWDYALVKVDGPNDYTYLFMDDNSYLSLAKGDDVLTTPMAGTPPYNMTDSNDVPPGPLGISHVSFLTKRTSVPEPFTMLLLGFGLVGLAGAGRKFKK